MAVIVTTGVEQLWAALKSLGTGAAAIIAAIFSVKIRNQLFGIEATGERISENAEKTILKQLKNFGISQEEIDNYLKATGFSLIDLYNQAYSNDYDYEKIADTITEAVKAQNDKALEEKYKDLPKTSSEDYKMAQNIKDLTKGQVKEAIIGEPGTINKPWLEIKPQEDVSTVIPGVVEDPKEDVSTVIPGVVEDPKEDVSTVIPGVTENSKEEAGTIAGEKTENNNQGEIEMPNIDKTEENWEMNIENSDITQFLKDLMKEQWAREDAIRAETQAREDNAWQRSVADMNKAGVNANLVNAGPAESGGGISNATGMDTSLLNTQMQQQTELIKQAIEQGFKGDENQKDRLMEYITSAIQMAGQMAIYAFLKKK